EHFAVGFVNCLPGAVVDCRRLAPNASGKVSLRLYFIAKDIKDARGGRYAPHSQRAVNPAAQLLLVEEFLERALIGEHSVAVSTAGQGCGLPSHSGCNNQDRLR